MFWTDKWVSLQNPRRTDTKLIRVSTSWRHTFEEVKALSKHFSFLIQSGFIEHVGKPGMGDREEISAFESHTAEFKHTHTRNYMLYSYVLCECFTFHKTSLKVCVFLTLLYRRSYGLFLTHFMSISLLLRSFVSMASELQPLLMGTLALKS